MFKNAKVDDRVFDFVLGHGTIEFIGASSNYPLSVVFDRAYKGGKTIRDNYSFDGRCSDISNQTLFWREFKIPEDARIKTYPVKGQKVLVWDDLCSYKHIAEFSHFDNGKIHTIIAPEYRVAMDSTEHNSWDNWELYEDKGDN